MRRRRVWQYLIWLSLLVGVSGGVVAWLKLSYFRVDYPYGKSHSCDRSLMVALERYAHDHNGQFPDGQESAEASLTVLYQQGYDVDAEILRGKTVPYDVVKKILDEGRLLSPETCGWHYVPGVRNTDDPRIAIFWDKVGLGHLGERLRSGGHYVGRISGAVTYVSEKEWPAFLEGQAKLVAQARASRQRDTNGD